MCDMNNIELLKVFELGKISESEKNKEVTKIFDGARRQIIEVNLRRGEILSKHKANEPITIFCLAGSGKFRAGKDLEEERQLEAGTLITLESGVDHEVVAEPEIHLLVTKFKEV